MSRVIRQGLVFGVVALFAVVSLVPAAHAQRRSGSGNYGFNNQQGSNQQGSKNNSTNNQNNNQGFNSNQSQNNSSDQDDDDKDKDKDKKNNNRNSNRNNNSNNQQNNNQQNNKNNNQQNDDQQNAQQVLKGQTGKQGNNFNQQGQSNNPQVQFKNNNSNQQFQNFQQQNNWQKKKWEGPHNVDVWNKQFNNGPKPFSSNWYNDHPKAWSYHHDHWDDNVWIVATVPGVGAWLGWDNYPRNNNIVYGYYPGGNQQQIVDPAIFGEWFPLGVYSLMTGPNDNGTRMLQLAVDRDGNLSGTYYDMITDTSHRVSGRIRQSSQRASWSIDTNEQLTFYAPLDQLTQQQGIVTVQMPGGEQQWQIVRLQNAGN
jgi:hypothetical protein